MDAQHLRCKHTESMYTFLVLTLLVLTLFYTPILFDNFLNKYAIYFMRLTISLLDNFEEKFRLIHYLLSKSCSINEQVLEVSGKNFVN